MLSYSRELWENLVVQSMHRKPCSTQESQSKLTLNWYVGYSFSNNLTWYRAHDHPRNSTHVVMSYHNPKLAEIENTEGSLTRRQRKVSFRMVSLEAFELDRGVREQIERLSLEAAIRVWLKKFKTAIGIWSLVGILLALSRLLGFRQDCGFVLLAFASSGLLVASVALVAVAVGTCRHSGVYGWLCVFL